MSKKEQFIEWCKNASLKYPMMEDVKIYFDAMCGEDKDKPLFTENGASILKYMQNNKDAYNNLFKAKEVAENIGLISRSVSGSCRKLVTDGYLEKMGDSPVIYSLTDKGISAVLE